MQRQPGNTSLQELQELHSALLGYANKCSGKMKEQLEVLLNAVNEVNAQLINNILLSAMLHGEILPANVKKDALEAALDNFLTGLNTQNERLQKLEKTLPVQIFVNEKSPQPVDQDLAIKTLNALGKTIKSLRIENNALAEEVRARRIAEQRGESTLTKQDQIVASRKPGKVS